MSSWQSKVVKMGLRLQQLRHSGGWGADLAAERKRVEAMSKRLGPPKGVTFTAVNAGDRPAEWITPVEGHSDGVILYLHGGAYIMGSIVSHRSLAATIALNAGARGLNLDYRLAPENPFPAAVEDAQSAFRWLLEQGISPQQVVVAGDSAGGGLALAMLLALRDAGQHMPAAAVCLSPWTDLARSGASWIDNAETDIVFDANDARLSAAQYLAGADPRTPQASPLYADLTGLPPLLIQVSNDELLLDDALVLAESARAAGVDVTLERWDDMIHVWQIATPFMPESRRAIANIGRFINGVWSGVAD
jgi:phosphinothricin tripeptide acetyl hydrolase